MLPSFLCLNSQMYLLQPISANAARDADGQTTLSHWGPLYSLDPSALSPWIRAVDVQTRQPKAQAAIDLQRDPLSRSHLSASVVLLWYRDKNIPHAMVIYLLLGIFSNDQLRVTFLNIRFWAGWDPLWWKERINSPYWHSCLIVIQVKHLFSLTLWGGLKFCAVTLEHCEQITLISVCWTDISSFIYKYGWITGCTIGLVILGDWR